MIKELLNEYTIGCLVHHENIRETLDYDVDHHCIIFEHFEGIDLFELLDTNGSLSYDNSIYIIKQLLDAVHYLHNLGIAHMDIKIENIMCNQNTLKIKLIDFGESIVFCYNNNNKLIKGLYGTETTAAPEVFLDTSYNADKTDIWSCGIILYEIIYCKLPWMKAIDGQPCFDLHKEHITKKNNLLTKIFPYYTPLTKKLFLGMLQVDPDKRILSNELLSFFSN